jgi:hypothetical protein
MRSGEGGGSFVLVDERPGVEDCCGRGMERSGRGKREGGDRQEGRYDTQFLQSRYINIPIFPRIAHTMTSTEALGPERIRVTTNSPWKALSHTSSTCSK